MKTETEGLPLSEKPQKDGIETVYKCGITFTGSWAKRLADHSEFCKMKSGQFILQYEKDFSSLLIERDTLKAENEELRQWKEGQLSVWTKVIDWCYANDQSLNMRVGDSISEKIIEALEQRGDLKREKEELIELLEEIRSKYFHCMTTDDERMIEKQLSKHQTK